MHRAVWNCFFLITLLIEVPAWSAPKSVCSWVLGRSLERGEVLQIVGAQMAKDAFQRFPKEARRLAGSRARRFDTFARALRSPNQIETAAAVAQWMHMVSPIMKRSPARGDDTVAGVLSEWVYQEFGSLDSIRDEVKGLSQAAQDGSVDDSEWIEDWVDYYSEGGFFKTLDAFVLYFEGAGVHAKYNLTMQILHLMLVMDRHLQLAEKKQEHAPLDVSFNEAARMPEIYDKIRRSMKRLDLLVNQYYDQTVTRANTWLNRVTGLLLASGDLPRAEFELALEEMNPIKMLLEAMATSGGVLWGGYSRLTGSSLFTVQRFNQAVVEFEFQSRLKTFYELLTAYYGSPEKEQWFMERKYLDEEIIGLSQRVRR